MMGTGVAEGDGRAIQAAQKAIASPLLEDSSVNGARGVIINVTGGPDMSLMEVNEASCIIQEAAHEDANIIFGAVIDPNLSGKLKITVIATGFQHVDSRRAMPAAATATPTDLSSYSQLKVAEGGAPPVAAAPVLSVRRPSIELPLTRVAGVGFAPRSETPATGAEGDELESPLDVPAFLRRQS
jgi:cell division protein FtsZ